MDTKGSGVKGNKVSRLQFLRLLGAGAIGYFVYRDGFINNNLFGNAATAARGGIANTTQQGHTMAGSLSSSTALAAAGRLDEDGILMMAIPKQGGYYYRFNTRPSS